MARKKLESLTEPMYYVLLALYKEPRHGYGIMQYVNQLTQGRVAVGAGTLYALLARFEEEQLIILTHTKKDENIMRFQTKANARCKLNLTA